MPVSCEHPEAPVISVIVPFRNAGSTLEAALASVLADEAEQEVLAIDDHSTDDGAEIARSFRNVRYLPPEEGSRGVVAATARGIGVSRGRYLAKMDADDISHPGRLAAQRAFLDVHPEVALCGTRVAIRRREGGRLLPPEGGFARFESWINGLNSAEDLAAERFVESPIVQPSVMMRREACEEAGGYRTCGWAEDYDLWLRMWERGMRLVNLPEVYLTWTDSPGRLSRTSDDYALPAMLACKAHYLARLPAVRERGVDLLGAGPLGKRLALRLIAEGVTPRHFFEVHPRRIGERIHGIPVRGMEDWPPRRPGSPVAVGTVGIPGRRAILEGLAGDRGYAKGVDFFPAA